MPNSICHFEIGCRDYAKAKDFYSKLFDWKWEKMPDGREMIRTGDNVSGHLNSLGHEPHHYVTFYIMVDDLAAAIQRAEAAGGKKIVGPVKEGPSGAFAWIQDPEGNVIGIYSENK